MTDPGTAETASTIGDVQIDKTRLFPLLLLSALLLGGWSLWALVLRPALPSLGSLERWVEPLARGTFWLLPAGLYLKRFWGKRWAQPLGLNFPLGAPQIVRAVAIGLLIAGLLVVSTAQSSQLGWTALLKNIVSPPHANWLAPLVEEFVCRGLVLGELINWARDSSKTVTGLRFRFYLGVLLSSLLFVLMHWPAWLPALGWDSTLMRSLPLLVTGVVLAFVFANTRSLWVCVLLHWLNNQLSLITAS